MFKGGQGKLKGEVTPAYSILNREDVQKVKTLFPDLKVILILRNPIDRAWSQIRFEIMKESKSSIDNSQRVKALIDSRNNALRSDYVRTLDIWLSYFPQEQMYIGFYDDIINDPKGVMSDIF